MNYLATLRNFGIGISDPLGADSWYRENFDFVTEGEIIAFLGPGEGHSLGLAVFALYNFLSLGKFVPFTQIGVGAGYIESNLKTQADGVIFYPQFGMGLNYFISGHWALNLSYRYQHCRTRALQNQIPELTPMSA